MIYHLAGQDIFISCPVSDLISFKAAGQQSGASTQPVSPCQPATGDERLAIHASGWVGDAERGVELHQQLKGFLLQVEGAAGLFISLSGDAISLLKEDKEPDWLDQQVIAGPGLVFALARQEKWCLHASAALFNNRLRLFLGESGEGKSTLAAYLAKQKNWERAADDILPVSSNPGGLTAWPQFPQLKLDADSQPGWVLEENIPIGCIFLLEPMGPTGKPGVELLAQTEATRVLLAHTAGTRLFTGEMLARHLEFCTRSAGQVPVFKIKIPRSLQALPAVRQLLEEHC